VAIGGGAGSGVTTGSENITIGWNAGAQIGTGSDNIDVGNPGVDLESGAIRIGRRGRQKKAFIAGVYRSPVNGTAVVVNDKGQLRIVPSSARYKETIKSMDNLSEAILSLKPVTFHYKKDSIRRQSRSSGSWPRR
jgi:hypothetical protein